MSQVVLRACHPRAACCAARAHAQDLRRQRAEDKELTVNKIPKVPEREVGLEI